MDSSSPVSKNLWTSPSVLEILKKNNQGLKRNLTTTTTTTTIKGGFNKNVVVENSDVSNTQAISATNLASGASASTTATSTPMLLATAAQEADRLMAAGAKKEIIKESKTKNAGTTAEDIHCIGGAAKGDPSPTSSNKELDATTNTTLQQRALEAARALLAVSNFPLAASARHDHPGHVASLHRAFCAILSWGLDALKVQRSDTKHDGHHDSSAALLWQALQQLVQRAAALQLPLHLPLYERLFRAVTLNKNYDPFNDVADDGNKTILVTQLCRQLHETHGTVALTSVLQKFIASSLGMTHYNNDVDTLSETALQRIVETIKFCRGNGYAMEWDGEWALQVVLQLRANLLQSTSTFAPLPPGEQQKMDNSSDTHLSAQASASAALVSLLEAALYRAWQEEEAALDDAATDAAVQAYHTQVPISKDASVEQMLSQVLWQYQHHQQQQQAQRGASTDSDDSDWDSDDDFLEDEDDHENHPYIQWVQDVLCQHLEHSGVRLAVSDWIRYAKSTSSPPEQERRGDDTAIPFRKSSSPVSLPSAPTTSSATTKTSQGSSSIPGFIMTYALPENTDEEDWEDIYQSFAETRVFPDIAAQIWKDNGPLRYTSALEEVIYARMFPERVSQQQNQAETWMRDVLEALQPSDDDDDDDNP